MQTPSEIPNVDIHGSNSGTPVNIPTTVSPPINNNSQVTSSINSWSRLNDRVNLGIGNPINKPGNGKLN